MRVAILLIVLLCCGAVLNARKNKKEDNQKLDSSSDNNSSSDKDNSSDDDNNTLDDSDSSFNSDRIEDETYAIGIDVRRDLEYSILVALPTEEDSVQWKEVKSQFQDSDVLKRGVLVIGDSNGIRFTAQKGKRSDADSYFQSIGGASVWLTSTTVLRVVEEGKMNLTSKPQEFISWWTNETNDTRSTVTLAQLLSFTSGFADASCSVSASEDDEEYTLESCAQKIYKDKLKFTPGTNYYYSSSHLTIAALMALKASGESDWNVLFEKQVKQVVGMSKHTKYENSENPMLATGVTTSVNEYAKFLQALLNGDLLSNETLLAMVSDHTVNVTMESSPVAYEGEDWHYGLGCWLECENSTWSTAACLDKKHIVSSPGAFYPFVDMKNQYYGIVGPSNYSKKQHIIRIIIIVVSTVVGAALLSAIGLAVGCVLYRRRRNQQQCQYEQVPMN